MEVKDQSVTDGQRELKGGAAARQECCKGPTHPSLRCSVAPALCGGLARFIMTALLPRCMCQQFEMALAVRCAVNAPSLTRATIMWWVRPVRRAPSASAPQTRNTGSCCKETSVKGFKSLGYGKVVILCLFFLFLIQFATEKSKEKRLGTQV